MRFGSKLTSSHSLNPVKSVLALGSLTMFVLCAAGCDARTSVSGGTTVRDSAGVRIVESAEPAWKEGQGWRLSEQPVLQLGVAEGDPAQEFDRITGVARLADGTLVVANGGSDELRYFAPDGRFLRSAGRAGEGPGEFQGLDGIWISGDSVFAYDALLHRISVFTDAGRFATSFPVPAVPGGGGQPPEVVGRLGDGTFLVRVLAPPPHDGVAGLRRDTTSYLRLRAPGELVGEVGRLPGNESFMIRDGRGMSGYGRPFGRGTQVATGADRVFVGTGDAYQVEVRSPEGRLQSLVRRTHQDVPVTAEDRERYRDAVLAPLSPQGRARMERVLGQIPFPETLPAHGRMLAGDDGSLWVVRYLPPGGGAPQWDVFDRDGRWLGTLRMPEGFRLQQVVGELALGTFRDDLGVESVRAYRMLK